MITDVHHAAHEPRKGVNDGEVAGWHNFDTCYSHLQASDQCCPVCAAAFDSEDDVIPINSSQDVVARLRAQLSARRKQHSKRPKKRQRVETTLAVEAPSVAAA